MSSSSNANTSGSRHISWDALQERIASGIPFIHRIRAPRSGVPHIDIRVSEGADELALLVPCSAIGELPVSPLAEMDIDFTQTPSGRVIEISTRTVSLFQDVYNFFVSVSDKIQIGGLDPRVAVEETLGNWRELLKSRSILSEEEQLGLRGELFLLRRLTKSLGDNALVAWVGPQKQPHDFRVGRNEFEVKATRGATHTHIINGLAQLEASPNHTLYVLSLRMAPAGAHAGTTLSDDIARTRSLLQSPAQLQFERILLQYFNYRKEHSDLYQLRLQMAAPPRLVPVDENCPRLVQSLLANVPHVERLIDVRYRAHFEGLGLIDGTPEFDDILQGNLNAE